MTKGAQHWLAVMAVAVMLMFMSMGMTGCNGSDGPRLTSVATLLEHSEAWQGEKVAVQGRIRSEEVPERYWLEGEGRLRLEVSPPERIGAYLGREVQISGRFEYEVEGQRMLRITKVTPLDKTTPDG